MCLVDHALEFPRAIFLNAVYSFYFLPQISTTKGTGGDVIILEEAAYIDPGFFYVSARPSLQRLVVA